MYVCVRASQRRQSLCAPIGPCVCLIESECASLCAPTCTRTQRDLATSVRKSRCYATSTTPRSHRSVADSSGSEGNNNCNYYYNNNGNNCKQKHQSKGNGKSRAHNSSKNETSSTASGGATNRRPRLLRSPVVVYFWPVPSMVLTVFVVVVAAAAFTLTVTVETREPREYRRKRGAKQTASRSGGRPARFEIMPMIY